MAVPENQHIIPPEALVGKRSGKRWFEVFRRWVVRCPECTEVRLVVGARENDRYVCRDCGHSFIITFPGDKRSEDY